MHHDPASVGLQVVVLPDLVQSGHRAASCRAVHEIQATVDLLHEVLDLEAPLEAIRGELQLTIFDRAESELLLQLDFLLLVLG